MTDTQSFDARSWIGRQIVGPDGDKIGKVAQIYLDDDTGQPAWATVRTGLFGNANSFVPLAGTSESGGDLVSRWDKETVKGAPNVEDDGDGYLTPEEEQQLYRYYRLEDGGNTAPTPQTTRTRTTGAPQGRDVSGPTTDDAMTRSEEELRVGTQRREAGRVRLRKYVVTEQVTQTVPVSHEEVRLEREPITDANRDAALQGEPISEEEHEIVLHEERPVVDKEVVPKERVRLATETVTEQAQVDEQVRKERIEQEGGGDRPRP